MTGKADFNPHGSGEKVVSFRRDGRGGSGTGGDDLEARVAQLEIHAQYIRRDLDNLLDDVRQFRGETKNELTSLRSEQKSDFRILFGALITACIGLAGLMAKGFGWL